VSRATALKLVPVTDRATAVRAFRVTLTKRQGDAFGLVVDETYGDSHLTSRVVDATPNQTGRVADALLTAVRGSGHRPSVLAFGRSKPIVLDEVHGLTTKPITKHERVRALVAGINAMSIEETYYWYSKCLGTDSSRALRALRTLLADD
jgi:hypothetical protein